MNQEQVSRKDEAKYTAEAKGHEAGGKLGELKNEALAKKEELKEKHGSDSTAAEAKVNKKEYEALAKKEQMKGDAKATKAEAKAEGAGLMAGIANVMGDIKDAVIGTSDDAAVKKEQLKHDAQVKKEELKEESKEKKQEAKSNDNNGIIDSIKSGVAAVKETVMPAAAGAEEKAEAKKHEGLADKEKYEAKAYKEMDGHTGDYLKAKANEGVETAKGVYYDKKGDAEAKKEEQKHKADKNYHGAKAEAKDESGEGLGTKIQKNVEYAKEVVVGKAEEIPEKAEAKKHHGMAEKESAVAEAYKEDGRTGDYLKHKAAEGAEKVQGAFYDTKGDAHAKKGEIKGDAKAEKAGLVDG